MSTSEIIFILVASQLQNMYESDTHTPSQAETHYLFKSHNNKKRKAIIANICVETVDVKSYSVKLQLKCIQCIKLTSTYIYIYTYIYVMMVEGRKIPFITACQTDKQTF